MARRTRIDLTQHEVRELLHYDPRTGVFIWRRRSGNDRITRTWNTRYAGKLAGTVGSGGIRIAIYDTIYKAHRLAWLYETGVWPPDLIDHKNLDSLDNRFRNLRLATDAQNHANSKLRLDNTSGIKGVYRDRGKWRAYVTANGHRIYGTRTENIDDAIAERRVLAEKHHRDFVRHA